MSWPYSQDFNNLNTASLSNPSQDGWTDDASSSYFYVNVQTSTVYEGAKALKLDGNSGQTSRVVRDVSGGQTGIMRFFVRKTANAGNFNVYLKDSSGSLLVQMCLDIDGNIRVGAPRGGTLVQAYSINTWYQIDWQYDTANNQSRISVDGGAWSNWQAGSSTGTISKLFLEVTAAASQTYIDKISSGSSAFTLSLTENITQSDSLLKQTGKIFSETLSQIDTIKRSIGRVITETITQTDTFAYLKQKFSVFTETITQTDNFFRNITKIFSETLTQTDNINRNLNKTILENSLKSDTISKGVGKTFTESKSLDDTVIRQVSRSFSENITKIDSIIRQFSKGLMDSITQTDLLIFIHKIYKSFTLLWKIGGTYTSKFSKKGDSYSSKFSKKGDTYNNKFPKKGDKYTNKF